MKTRTIKDGVRTLEQAADDLRREALRTLDVDMFCRALVLEKMAFRQRLRAIVKE